MSRAHTSAQSIARPASGGFTLIELLVTLAVASVLIGLAAPAFNQLVRQRDMSAQINDFVAAVAYARSEAIRRGTVVALAAQAPAVGNEWGGGYCVVEASGSSAVSDALAPCTAADRARLLRVVAAIPNSALAGSGGLSGVVRISFSGRGLPLQPVAGRVTLCSQDDAIDPGRYLDLAATGRTAVGEHQCHGG
ncbi:MAG: GspH/FimT family pseudopilin [Gammaproteobacteria bacterium]